MQQMYSCPNCGAPVAYGQPQCTNCGMLFNWQPEQDQYQHQQQYTEDRHWDEDMPGDGSQEVEVRPSLLAMIQAKRGLIAKIGVTLIMLTLIAGGVIAFQAVAAKWFAPPVIASFTASAASVTSGQEVTLSWDVAEASGATISPDIGAVFPKGSRKVAPADTITYKLNARNSFGSAQKSVTITVMPAMPVINNFRFSPDSIAAGQPTTLSWNVSGATAAAINPNVGDVAPSGSQSLTPTSTTNYTLTASSSAGNASATATITVSAAKSPIILSFAANPANIVAGESTTLSWDVIGSGTLYFDQGLGGVPPKGFKELIPTATTTYTITADSSNGKVTRSVTVTVDNSAAAGRVGPAVTKDPPVINSFSASPSSVMLGDNMTLTWNVRGARTTTITPDIGDVPSSGWTMVVPAGTTTYQLAATNTFGKVTADVTVTVNRETDGAAPVIKSFTASPNRIQPGGISSLMWEVKGDTLLIINQGIGVPISRFSQQVSPSATTTYTLTAINKYGTDNATVTVSIMP